MNELVCMFVCVCVLPRLPWQVFMVSNRQLRQTDRQKERQTDTQGKHTGRQTDTQGKHTDTQGKHTGRQTERQTDTQGKHTDRGKQCRQSSVERVRVMKSSNPQASTLPTQLMLTFTTGILTRGRGAHRAMSYMENCAIFLLCKHSVMFSVKKCGAV